MSSSLFVFGCIAGRRTKMLVDTGSAVTIVKENVWEEVKENVWEEAGCDSLESPVRKLVTANGQEMELAGQGEVEMKIGDLTIRHVVLVTKTLTHDCLLGADFLTAHGCVVDLQRNVVLIAGNAVPLACKSNADENRVCHVTVADKYKFQQAVSYTLVLELPQTLGKY